MSVNRPTNIDKSSHLLADYVSKADLANEFDVSIRTIERWIRLRLLPQPIRLGRTRRFHVPTLRKHLEAKSSERADRRGRR